jgi:hypothetical protein
MGATLRAWRVRAIVANRIPRILIEENADEAS